MGVPKINKSKLRDFYDKHVILCNVAMIGCVALFLCFFALFFIDVWTNHGRTTVVPEVRKKSFAEATEILDRSHLKYEISDSVYDSDNAPGTVKEIWPHPGTHVKPGRVIYLTVNSFEPQRITISMPLTGVSSRQAISYLESLNIKNLRIVYVPSSFPDLVEGAKYNGENITPGMQIPVNANVVLEVGTSAGTKRAPADDYTPLPSEASDDDIPVVDHNVEAPKPEPKPEPSKPVTTPDVSNPDIFD